MAGRDDWDGHWQRYATAAARNPAQQMRHRIALSLLRRASSNGAGMRLLDIGSGQGDLLMLLHRMLPAASLAGFELSRTGVEITRQKVPVARVCVVDVFQPPPEAATFAGWATHAVCSEVLEHVDDPSAFLGAARRYLAAEARLVITVPGGPMSAFDRHIGHRRHFNRASVAAVLRDGGFEVERVFRAGVPFFNMYRLLVIARGKKLATDVEVEKGGATGLISQMMMTLFQGLFRLNLGDCPGGWQIVAVGRALERRVGSRRRSQQAPDKRLG